LATEREWEAVGDGFDFDQTIEASFERDSWVVFVAWGPVPAIGWGHGKPALAFTNPIYIDTDGDIDGNGDVWEEPGPGIIEVDRLGLNWCD
jgi:hypothetical protein